LVARLVRRRRHVEMEVADLAGDQLLGYRPVGLQPLTLRIGAARTGRHDLCARAAISFLAQSPVSRKVALTTLTLTLTLTFLILSCALGGVGADRRAAGARPTLAAGRGAPQRSASFSPAPHAPTPTLNPPLGTPCYSRTTRHTHPDMLFSRPATNTGSLRGTHTPTLSHTVTPVLHQEQRAPIPN